MEGAWLCTLKLDDETSMDETMQGNLQKQYILSVNEQLKNKLTSGMPRQLCTRSCEGVYDQIHKGGNYLAQNEKDFWSLLWFTLVYFGLLWFTLVYFGLLWFTLVYFTLVTLSAETLLETKKTPRGLFVQIQILEENIRMDIGFSPLFM
jgi:hypothetical protein